jgi:predicted nucleotide-binding protein
MRKGSRNAIEITIQRLEGSAIKLHIIEKPLPQDEKTRLTYYLTKMQGRRLVRDRSAVFVVHGRNRGAREALFTFLRSIGLHPLEWSEIVKATEEGSPYVGKVLEEAFSMAQAAVILMTPDDEARLSKRFWQSNDPPYETKLTPQARPNVIFEAGMAMGRCPDRTIIIELGAIRPFSDIVGRHVIRMDGSIGKRQELADRLKTAGCTVNLAGTDWQTAGDFKV